METPIGQLSSAAILCLDLGKTSGAWALLIDEEVIDHGVVSFHASLSNIQIHLEMVEIVSRILKDYEKVGINAVVYENAYGQIGRSAHEIFYGLAYAVREAAWKKRIPTYVVNTPQLKKAATGVANFKGKLPTMKAIDQRYPELELDLTKEHPASDIADAIAVGLALRDALRAGRARLAA